MREVPSYDWHLLARRCTTEQPWSDGCCEITYGWETLDGQVFFCAYDDAEDAR